MRYVFDHLVIAAERLEEGVAWAEARLGCALERGGAHPRYGTHNALLGLEGGIYLEVIAVDPEAEPEVLPRWFGLDGFAGAPRLLTWVCRCEGLRAARLPEGFARVADLQRGALRWRMGEAEGGALPFDQCHPGLIDWGDTPPPPTRLRRSKIALERLELAHPRAEELAVALSGLDDARVTVSASDKPELRAGLRGPDGREVIL